MFKFLISFITICCISIAGFSQKTGNQNYHAPLGIPLILASNFGELRPNHFHMGLDYKTNGRIGYNIYSIEDGFVSRVKISPYGYGKVVYIDHPNGITSVYAHCSEFKGEIDSLVKATQIAEQNYAIEVYPIPNSIKVNKGEVIAISGNTGGSTAPHLHFELRDTKTEHALNPLLYGFEMEDSRKPEIRGVKIYGLTKDGYRYPGKAVRRTAIKSGATYTISSGEISIPSSYLTESGGLGLAFDVIDRFDGANNQCGLYGSYLIVNGDTIFGQKTTRVPFESTRFVNSHKDYNEYAMNKRKFHKSFRVRENDLPIYTTEDLGIISAKPGDELSVLFDAFDVSGNKSTMKFKIKIIEGKTNANESLVSDISYLVPSESMRVTGHNCSVDFGKGTVYEPMRIDGDAIDRKIGVASEPLHKPYRIFINHDGVQDGKHYVHMTINKGRTRALGIKYKDSLIVCEAKYFGTYRLRRDTIAPSIAVSNFSTTTTQKILKWKISDDASGLNDYDLFIDDEWHLLEYEYKNNTISFQRPKDFLGTKKVKVIVEDNCGNKKVWNRTITFK